MRLPSFDALLNQAGNTFSRFPLTLLIAFTGTISAMMLIERSFSGEEVILTNLLLTCALGLPLMLSATLLGEARKLMALAKWGLQLAALSMLLLYYFSLPDQMEDQQILRFFIYAVAFHMLVAFAPYTQKESYQGFWQYNKILFLRFLTTVLYSIVIFTGLSIALALSTLLLELDINEKTYSRLWLLVTGVFNTWMFLSGIPENFDLLENDEHYPKGLKIFTQFVLLPLVVVYLGILYLYMIKVIFQFSLPKGMVSWLVNIFSVMGILSLLLIYPLRHQSENKWISLFGKWFFRALFPLISLLAVAIGVRVWEYGITENRYLVLAVAAWLLIIAIYYLLKGFHRIRFIPMSLFVLAIIAATGPFSAFNVSIKSQNKRLLKNLEKAGMLQNDGKIHAVDTLKNIPSKELQTEIAEGIDYLADRNRLKPILDMLAIALPEEDKETEDDEYYFSNYELKYRLIPHLNIENYANRSFYAETDEARSEYEYFKLSIQKNQAIPLRGAGQLIEISTYDIKTLFDNHYPTGDSSSPIILNKGFTVEMLIERFSNLGKNHHNKTYYYDIKLHADSLYFHVENHPQIKGIQFDYADYTKDEVGSRISNYRCWILLKE